MCGIETNCRPGEACNPVAHPPMDYPCVKLCIFVLFIDYHLPIDLPLEETGTEVVKSCCHQTDLN